MLVKTIFKGYNMINSKYAAESTGVMRFLTPVENTGKYTVGSVKHCRVIEYIDDEGNVEYDYDTKRHIFYKLNIQGNNNINFISYLGVDWRTKSTIMLVYRTICAKHIIQEKLESKGMTLDYLNDNIFVRNGDVTYIDVLTSLNDECGKFHGQSRLNVSSKDPGVLYERYDLIDKSTNAIVIGADYSFNGMILGPNFQSLKDNFETISKLLYTLCDSLSEVTLEEIVNNIDKI